MSALLQLKDVNYCYLTYQSEIEALKNITFSVERGEFASIVGPSGCGKTTILSLISSLLTPSSGEILLSGKPVESQKHLIGYMFQRDGLFAWRTIWQNVTLGLEIQRKKAPQRLEKATELLKKYDLYAFKDKKPDQLSGGMRQRAALIRTLVLEPELLLLDEPFSALDFQTRLKVCDDVYSIIKTEKKTAILVTHDISEALSLSDKIVVLTQRPASVKRVYTINFSAATPLARREEAGFGGLFDKIWRDLINAT